MHFVGESFLTKQRTQIGLLLSTEKRTQIAG